MAEALHVSTNQELFQDKVIAVLGGTGYLGRSIAAEVLKYNPRRVIVYSRDEVKHFVLERFFNKDARIQSVIGDIRNYETLDHALRGVDIVFHVAALKRMDAMESNVWESIQTNSVASMNVFRACVANNVDKALFISTDKACLPINTYGACKFISEKIFTNYDIHKYKTKFMVTRFGNILESTGSVIPIFLEKLKHGEPLTLTHEQMTRFIIGWQEATEIIFDALRYGVGGEIFLRKLSAMRIVDLINILRRNFSPASEMKLIGLRPGEKLHEVLINSAEMARTYEFKNCLIVRSSIADTDQQLMKPLPIYMQEGHRFDAQGLDEYNSSMAVVAEKKLEKIFFDLGILTLARGVLTCTE